MEVSKRNFWILMCISCLFGIAIGLYEFALPYYLKGRGISYEKMGYVFAISFFFVLFVQIFSARLSDLSGRKPFYSLSALFSAISTFLTPLSTKISILTFLKTIRETAGAIQDTIGSVILYESISRTKYLFTMSRISGFNFLFQGAGIFAAGLLMLQGYDFPFFVAGGAVFLAFLLFQIGFREIKVSEEDEPVVSFSGDLRLLNKNLILLTVSGFIANMGVALSHTQMMPLFFSVKYGVKESWVAVLLAFHRISFGLPMIFTGNWLKGRLLSPRNLKWLYILFLGMQDIAISGTAFMPTFPLAAGVWLVHDAIGASVWAPVRSTLLQYYSRDETRALQIALVGALSNIGWMFGPIIAGYLANIDISLPFSMSGALAFLGIFPMMALDVERQ
ncbi:MFS transporter [bacterium]|nr:MFS transporter [bacterium]